MTDSFASHRSIRVQLESNFDDYLEMIVDYLSVEHGDLQLPQELSNELAATVIVRVSHAKPEPADLDAALFAAADALVAVRRPQLSRASQASEENFFASDSPASVPSLRLIQRPRRGAAVDDVTEADPADALNSGRLSLADPPLDLSRALRLSPERTNRESDPEPEPAPASASASQKTSSSSRDPEATRVRPEPDPTRARAPTEAAEAEQNPAQAEQNAAAEAEQQAARVEQQAAQAEAEQQAAQAEQQAARVEQQAAQVEQKAARAEPGPLEVQPKVRRKPTPVQAERWRKRSQDGRRKDTTGLLSAPDLSLRFHSLGSETAPTLPDEIAMLAMMGFPNNPNRAARLCVVALAEELELEPAVDLSSQMERVSLALEALSATLLHAELSPRHAAMEWQRVARKATLQAFFCDRI